MAVRQRTSSDSTSPEQAASSNPIPDADAQPHLAACLYGALAAFILSTSIFVAWMYAFPDGYAGAMAGLNPRALTQFQEHLPFHFSASLEATTWSLGFRLLLMALWGTYALALLSVLRGATPSPRVVFGAVIACAGGMAFFCPPLLTTDGYSYLGYSHLHVLYGLNPYVTTTAPLFAHGDPVTHFLFWQVPTVYGPVWTALTDVIVRALPGSLWCQVVAVKLIEAIALGIAALAGQRIADRFRPGSGVLTLLAIGLNPLLLIEGPGSGHNDLLMIALALCSASFLQKKHWGQAGLLLGLSVGVKLVTLALLPWLLQECRRHNAGRARCVVPLILAAGALLPSLLGYAAFWHGPDTLLALQQRSLHGFDPAAQARTAQIGGWLSAHGIAPRITPLLTALYQRRILLVVYALLSIWLWRSRAAGGWRTAWIMFAPVLMFTGMGDPFPWYIVWFLPFALLRWDKPSLGLSTGFLFLSLLWESFYACLVRLPGGA